MANIFTNKQYQSVKNESYVLVKFNREGRRVITISGLSLYSVVQELIKNSEPLITLVINRKDLPKNRWGDGDINTLSWNIMDYDQYFKMKKNLF